MRYSGHLACGFVTNRVRFAFVQAARYNDCQTAGPAAGLTGGKKMEQLMRRRTLLLACGIILSVSTAPAIFPGSSNRRCNARTGHVYDAGRPSQHDGATWNHQAAARTQWQPDGAEPCELRRSGANPYPDLPEILTLKDGALVTTPEQWWSKRRPEIVEDFDREVLGRVPAKIPKVTWTVVELARNEDWGNGGHREAASRKGR